MTTVLTIAGSDSGGGAGIQADLKTFAAWRVFGLTAVTAVTAQNSRGVTAVHAVPPGVVAEQIRAVVSDFGARAAKTGMLVDAATVAAVAASLAELRVPNLIVDPVMAATSGARLLADDAIALIRNDLLPQARVVTPNRAEAELLTGRAVDSVEAAGEAARRLHDMGPGAVIVTGGHLPGADAVDLLFDGRDLVELRSARIETADGHGTGCTFGAALAALLAIGRPLPEAAREAKRYVEQALRHAVRIGRGPGPLDHFWQERPLLYSEKCRLPGSR